jgi:lipopolysaccharide export system permease protein
MILDFYIARKFLWLFARVFGGFLAIMMMIDIIDQLRRFGDPGISVGDAVVLSAMNVPASLYRILPLVLILAAIGLFLGLSRSSELVVLRASGRSGLRFLLAPVVTALLLGGFAVAVLNPLVAATSKRYDVLSSGHARGGSVLSVSDAGLWLRQGDDQGQTVIQARRANLDGTELYDATFLTFDETGSPRARIEAASAALSPGFWVLTEAKSWPLETDNPERAATAQPDGLRIATDLTQDAIRSGFGTPSAISFWNLPTYIEGLDRAGFSAHAHRVWLQMELALPVFLVSMVLIAAAATMRHARVARTGAMVLFALGGGFALFFLRNFAQVLGENGQIPIEVAAWSPPVAGVLLALGLILHLEDG